MISNIKIIILAHDKTSSTMMKARLVGNGVTAAKEKHKEMLLGVNGRDEVRMNQLKSQ